MKKLILLLFAMVLVSGVSAGLIGPFQQGENINIPQTCDDCTFNNITAILYPNSSIIVSNVVMSQDGTYFNYTLHSNFTNALGTYIVNGLGDLNGVNTVWTYDFEVTRNGQDFTTGKAISYLGFIVILLFTFLLTMYGAFRVRWKHLRSDTDKIITINNFRYFKVLLFTISYFELMFLFGLSYKFFNEANIGGFTEFFNFIYQLFLNLIYPLMIFLIIVVFAIWINNKNLSKRLNLGLDR